MKSGHRPIIINGVYMVPEHPTYWEVPAVASAAVEQFVAAGTVEYEQAFARTAAGTFAAPGLEVVQRQDPPNAADKFARKSPGRPRKDGS